MIAIQKEWKTIGIVPRKYDSTGNGSFQPMTTSLNRKLHASSQHEEEVNNYEKKREIGEDQQPGSPDTEEALPLLRQLG